MSSTVTMTWELLAQMCVKGATMTWPDSKNYAICTRGFSASARVTQVTVNPNYTITIYIEDPATTDTGDTAAPLWELRAVEASK